MNGKKEKRRKKREYYYIHERWLLTYSDLITLLVAFFIIVYAMTAADSNKQKFDTLVQNINHAIFGKSIQMPIQKAQDALRSYTSGKLTEETTWEDRDTYAFSNGENLYLVKMNSQNGDVQNIATLQVIK